ncbi:MAG TPA: HEAT repeat domain-containing protein, partial [Leptolyngbya sp.]|nr:HEAT repeat domain-containing protein [Leptolyngbya sp.]
MQKLNYHERLELAHTEANEQNWGRLGQDLQQLLGDEDSTRATADATIELLNLAMQVLEYGSFHDRWEVSKIFSSFGTASIAPLINLLDDEDADPEVQWFAVRILGQFDHPQVVEALIEVLKTSQSEDLNSIVISALANLKDAVSALEPL